MMEEENFLFH